MSSNLFKCDICDKAFSRNYNLIRHKHLLHKNFNHADSLKPHKKAGVDLEQMKKDLEQLKKDSLKKVTLPELDTDLKEVTVAEAEMAWKIDEYDEMVEYGQSIHKMLLGNSSSKEEAIVKNSRMFKALQLYQTKINIEKLDMNSVILRPWQTRALSFVDTLSDRKIIFIMGGNGNEGKSFLQNYILQLHSSSRVFKSELNGRGTDIAHLISEEKMIERKDIFLFNVTRATKTHEIAYDILEKIKDGDLPSLKYQSKKVTFKTPNCVIVFTTQPPNLSSLSRDRYSIWIIDGCGQNMRELHVHTSTGNIPYIIIPNRFISP